MLCKRAAASPRIFFCTRFSRGSRKRGAVNLSWIARWPRGRESARPAFVRGQIKIRNPKHEIRDKFQITSMNVRNKTRRPESFEALAFGTSNLSRISDSNFLLRICPRVIHFPIERLRQRAKHSAKHGPRDNTPRRNWNMLGKMSSTNA